MVFTIVQNSLFRSEFAIAHIIDIAFIPPKTAGFRLSWNNGILDNNAGYCYIIIMLLQRIVSITRSGQLTIPKNFREKLGIIGGAKAVIKLKDNSLFVSPHLNFKQLSGSLGGNIKLTNRELKKARKAFQTKWADEEK